MNKPTPDKSVAEIVDWFKNLEEMCDNDSDQIVAMYRRNIRDFVKAERQKREEVVEEIKKQLTRLYDDFYHHGTQKDNSTTFITEKDFDNIVKALTHPNNPK